MASLYTSNLVHQVLPETHAIRSKRDMHKPSEILLDVADAFVRSHHAHIPVGAHDDEGTLAGINAVGVVTPSPSPSKHVGVVQQNPV